MERWQQTLESLPDDAVFLDVDDIDDSEETASQNKPIYTIDIETDPFAYGKYPAPFTVGFFDGEEFTYFWGDDCIEKMFSFLAYRPPGIIYAHNGGRFDIYYFLKYIVDKAATIIGSRIVKARVPCVAGHHEFRDSFAIMPFGLKKAKGKVQKLDIDINKMRRRVRNKHRAEIIEYLKEDCRSLWYLVTDFLGRFGDNLTIGATAMREILKLHTFAKLTEKEDTDLRDRFFYGGRVQCFKKGIHKGDWKVFDVNSMYPFAMQTYKHPISKPTFSSTRIRKNTCFLTVTGTNKGAFPQRTRDGGITFDVKYGTFHISIHEWNIAEKYGLFECDKIDECINFDERATFAEFVDTFYNKRNDARASMDENGVMFYKFVMNSGYGKFAQNPSNYTESIITSGDNRPKGDGWTRVQVLRGNRATDDEFTYWEKPAKNSNRYNVATGASITGAARSILMEALATAKNPIYCDTDSVICEDLPGANVDGSKLGAWKLEATADTAAIAGKKLYALFSGRETVKQANKGVKVTSDEIKRIAKGETIKTFRDAPSFALDGSYRFIQRTVRMT